jgi:hypothetical protein
LPLAVASGQIAPGCAGAQNPQDATGHLAIADARSTRGLSGKQTSIKFHCASVSS